MRIEQITEKWSKKYKSSINCSNPKGFSQKAHCAGRKKKTNEAPQGFASMNLDAEKVQQSIDYFYTDHAPNNIGGRKEEGSFKGFKIVSFTKAPDTLMFLVDNNDQAVFYVAYSQFEKGVAIGNVRSNGTVKATEVYAMLVDKFGTLYSDLKQTPQGSKIWSSLAKFYPNLAIKDTGDRLIATKKTNERELTKSEKSKMRKYEKDIPKKDFIKRYGKKEGESIYYGTITNMAKKASKKESIEEAKAFDPILDLIKEKEQLYELSYGNCGVLAIALDQKFDMDQFIFVTNPAEPDKLYHVAAVKGGKIYDADGVTNLANVRSRGFDDDYPEEEPEVESVPADQSEYRYILKGTEPDIEVSNLVEGKRIPRKKGQPAGSKKHSDLYTDENPKGTIKGLKFATVADAKASVSKIRNSGKKHAHKIQAAVAMEQRAKAAGKASAAAVYRTYINAMKKKTKKKNESTYETKEAPAGHYFTKSGNLVKGKLTKDAKERGARETDPKDNTRSKIPAVTQYNEGVNDPHIFKAVFMAGGPGSGKSFVAQNLLGGTGLRPVNSDEVYEFLLKRQGLTLGPDDIASDKGQEIRGTAKDLTDKRQQNYIDGRLGLIIDGTGKVPELIQKLASQLKSIGYSVSMIFVNTSLEVAQQRNLERERTLPKDIVANSWNEVQQNLMKYQQIFGADRFHIIDNSGGLEDLDRTKNFDKVYNEVQRFINTPPKHKKALEWIQNQKAQNNAKQTTDSGKSDGGVTNPN